MEINTRKIEELIDQYGEAETRRERREIKNKVLEATVWQHDQAEPFAAFSLRQFEMIAAAVETDDKEVQRLLRTPYVDRF